MNMITKIVRLKRVVTRWKSKSLRRRGSVLCHSSDSDGNGDSPRRTPSGCVAVYVGPLRRRFLIPTRFLNLPVFVSLLDQAEEEFGFQKTGGLALPCEPSFFAEILRFLDEDEEKFRSLSLDDFLKMISELGYQISCKESSSPAAAAAFSPLLHKTRA